MRIPPTSTILYSFAVPLLKLSSDTLAEMSGFFDSSRLITICVKSTPSFSSPGPYPTTAYPIFMSAA